MDRTLALKEIEAVVVDFYRKAVNDILIGYHFRHIPDFSTHIPRIIDFWERQLLREPYRGEATSFQFIAKHLPLKIKRGEVGRWVLLFERTLAEHHLAEISTEKWQARIKHLQNLLLKAL